MPEAFADAIIVAAGMSRRMGGRDKLLEAIDGRPALAWSVAAMVRAPSVTRLVLVAAPERVSEMMALPWLHERQVTVVAGGERRQDSVAAGLAACDSEVVLVHDGARPFVKVETVEAVAAAARQHGAALPVLPLVDSVKRVGVDGCALAVDRAGLFRAQTPQGARRELLEQAFAALTGDGREWTDEAALLEAFGVAVATVPGDARNVKLTEPADLEAARAMAARAVADREGGTLDVDGDRDARSLRYGNATDRHPFGPADGLLLGGIEVAGSPRLFGHSDGDVVLHAIADACLGAAGLGDLGRQFPAADPATGGADSARLLRIVLEHVAAEGWRPASADVSIVGARPRLGGARLDAIRASLSVLLGVPLERIGVRASTGNLSGDDGYGLAISASALVGLVRL
ncbi:MAG: 2-C-methyl-D-erythritol 4-phosphate cytidylyltransferase [Chloroflexota bacterium]|nr:2-C-methyl-D-erythritol 4-phosphate cytidylyltransferase [Chloroflexota bacterium]